MTESETPTPSVAAIAVIDHLSAQAYDLIIKESPGVSVTRQQFADAHARTFDALLTAFLENLDKASPGLAEELRAEFVAEMEAQA
jgi:hypothetical protein